MMKYCYVFDVARIAFCVCLLELKLGGKMDETCSANLVLFEVSFRTCRDFYLYLDFSRAFSFEINVASMLHAGFDCGKRGRRLSHIMYTEA